MKKEKGITLIVLILTVTILAILVLLSFDLVVDKKLFSKSNNTVEKANNKLAQDQNVENSLLESWDETIGVAIKTGTKAPPCKEHKYGEWQEVTQATCTTAGSKTRTCTVCGTTQTKTSGAALGHNWVDEKIITEATYTTTGSRTQKCSKCGETRTVEIPTLVELEHNWEISGDTLTCAHCKKTYTIGEQINYTATGTGSTSITAAMSGYTSDQTLTVDTDTKWVVLGAENTDNDENGTNETLLITTEKPTTGTIYLKGAAAYNNCIDEINRMCKELYGENARGMTIEDVNNCLQYTPEGGMYVDASYNTQTINNLTTKLSDLPIWDSIKDNHYTPDGKNTEEALGEYLLDGYSYKISSTGATDARKNVILASNSSYWLASRGVVARASYGYASFTLGWQSSDTTCSAYESFHPKLGELEYPYSLRPIVSLTSEI